MPAGGRDPGVLVEVPRLLHDLLAGREPSRLPGHLVADRALDTAQGVDVLGLGPRAERHRCLSVGNLRPERHVGVAAQRALVHPDVADAEGAQQVAQRGDVRPGDLGRPLPRTLERLGHDLDQRDAGAVVVDQGVLRAVDPAGLRHRRAATCRCPPPCGPARSPPGRSRRRRARRRGSRRRRSARRTGWSGSSSACPGRSSSSARTGTTARSCSAAPGRSGSADSTAIALTTGRAPGRPRQVGQTWVFGSAPNTVAQPQNILVPVFELDVDLQAQHRVEPLERLVVGQDRLAHRATSSSGARSSSGPPQRSSSRASSAAPTA